jgi:mRNA interferase MazF
MGMVAARRFDVFLVSLDPTIGVEMKKTRPCVVVSPDEMNRHLCTVIIAPLTSRGNVYPSRVALTFQGKKGQIVLDQIRTVDRTRLVRKLGVLTESTAKTVSRQLVELFAY